MGIKKEMLGEIPDGTQVELYTMENGNGVRASFTNLGALWVTMEVPDREGNLGDVVLGYDTVEKLAVNTPHFGAPIGRNSNRIGGASFTINGNTYRMAQNNGTGNNLHSGPHFYHTRIWDMEMGEYEENQIVFSLFSPDGDQGFPGNLNISISYTLTEDNSLMIEYEGVSDEDTLFNMTNHSYFNLEGHGKGTVLNQEAMVNADFFTAADEESIPTGEVLTVKGTPMDFREWKPLGQDINADYIPLIFGNGYDHNYVLKTEPGEPSLAAALKDMKSGRLMEVYTDLPGMHLYTGNFLNGDVSGKGGAVYNYRSAVCFETQFFPNAVNELSFKAPILKAGDLFKTVTIFKFSIV